MKDVLHKLIEEYVKGNADAGSWFRLPNGEKLFEDVKGKVERELMGMSLPT